MYDDDLSPIPEKPTPSPRPELQQPLNLQPNHRKRIKTYGILARVFLPVGIVLLAVGISMMIAGVPFAVTGYKGMVDAGECVVKGQTTTCSGPNTEVFALGIILLSCGFSLFVPGVPIFVLNFVFRHKSRAYRRIDEENGIRYDDLRYGK